VDFDANSLLDVEFSFRRVFQHVSGKIEMKTIVKKDVFIAGNIRSVNINEMWLFGKGL
jgi:hypothetical protein